MDPISAKLQSLGYAPAPWRVAATEEFVSSFERDRGLRLPAAYRSFLLEFGAMIGEAKCDFLEPITPVGQTCGVDLFYGRAAPDAQVYDVRWATDAAGLAPEFVAVAKATWGFCMVVVRCGGPDDGSVYLLDADQRSLWPDEEFRRMFPALHPRIEDYLERRRAGRLPAKPAGYESLYLVARDLDEFLARLEPVTYDDDSDSG
ncbi:SMI1/KNR4 family protein [Paludisphaera soli]|uniref:SMI1/KNR4 family protein n=1 Tax=Paludisphaera soli TaxID=2712865 RepID=UPI0013EDC4B7|nr:SMI1/KNR4 family protein [Paludisphaera soli]